MWQLLRLFLKRQLVCSCCPFSSPSCFYSAPWKADVMAGILATILDHEDKDNTLKMMEWLGEACVPEGLEEEGFYSRSGHLHLDY